MEATRVYLKDYRAPDFSVHFLDLDFNLQSDFCRVKSKMEIETLRAGAPLVLNGVDLELVALKIDGQDVAAANFSVTAESLTLSHVPKKFTLEIETKIHPKTNTSLEGLYSSGDSFVTQCEAQGFRKISYFLDRPDVMTRYTVRIEADKKTCPILLSNGDRIHVKDLGNGRHEALWKDPHKKPCYLFALFAGDLGVIRDTFTTRSGRKVNLEVYATHGKQDRCHHAMESLKKSMKWDEEAFGREYDLNDYMIVAIDDFNAGAMENKGLNIFNSRLVLADANSATDQDFHNIESVVAHEYFHNWTGNRVTLQNWFHLSLKEGLTVFRDQEFSADMTDRGVQRIRDVNALRERQFPEDQGPTAHPVRPESCLAVDNFFTMTIYEKGAELIRMMQNTVGRKGFRKGMDLYFERHDGQAVTTDDFAAAIADANKADFSQLKLWYSQAGTPRVKVTEAWNASTGEYTLNFAQTCPPTPGQDSKQPFQIPVLLGLLDWQGRELPLIADGLVRNSDDKPILHLRKPNESYTFKGLKEKPIASLFREFSAPIVLEFDRDEKELFFLMAKDTDGFNRCESAKQAGLRVLSRLVADCKQGRKPQADAEFLSAWSAALKADLDPAEQASLLSLPSDAMLLQHEEMFDAQAFREARHFLVSTLGRTNRSELLGLYRRWHGVDAQKQNSKTFGHRSLKNLALSVLAQSGDPEVLDLAFQQFEGAQNMTDRMSALMILTDSQDARKNAALEKFHQDWRSDSLVLNKWFGLQASADSADVLNRVKALTQHADYSKTNPNNVYSLLRTFSINMTRFHDEKNPAYAFFADQIIEIDALNPQVGARLCAAFNIVGKLSVPLQKEAAVHLKRILAQPGLSKNSRELLQPALDLISS